MEEPTTRAPVQYVLVRKDMPVDRQMVYVGHAARESIRVAPTDKRCVLRLLWVNDETELRAFAEKLVSKNFHVGLVLETDGPYAGQAPALGVEPMTERISALGKLFYHLAPVRIPAPAFEE